MTNVITGADILPQVRTICADEGEVVIAVSYWGKGATEALGLNDAADNVHVVLNVEHGGTNPRELERLMEVLPGRVRIHSKLHSKIYASRKLAAIGSANASASGLHLKCVGHAETMALLHGDDAEAAFALADKFYTSGRSATSDDIELCERRFGAVKLAETVDNNPPLGDGASELNWFDFFVKRDDIFWSMPIILTEDRADPNVLKKDWENQIQINPELFPDKKYNDKNWDYYQRELDQSYHDKICLEIYRVRRGEFSLHLVQPIYGGKNEGTFVRRLPWSTIDELSGYLDGNTEPNNVTTNNLLLGKVHIALSGKEPLSGWDIYRALDQNR